MLPISQGTHNAHAVPPAARRCRRRRRSWPALPPPSAFILWSLIAFAFQHHGCRCRVRRPCGRGRQGLHPRQEPARGCRQARARRALAAGVPCGGECSTIRGLAGDAVWGRALPARWATGNADRGPGDRMGAPHCPMRFGCRPLWNPAPLSSNTLRPAGRQPAPADAPGSAGVMLRTAPGIGPVLPPPLPPPLCRRRPPPFPSLLRAAAQCRPLFSFPHHFCRNPDVLTTLLVPMSPPCRPRWWAARPPTSPPPRCLTRSLWRPS